MAEQSGYTQNSFNPFGGSTSSLTSVRGAKGLESLFTDDNEGQAATAYANMRRMGIPEDQMFAYGQQMLQQGLDPTDDRDYGGYQGWAEGNKAGSKLEDIYKQMGQNVYKGQGISDFAGEATSTQPSAWANIASQEAQRQGGLARDSAWGESNAQAAQGISQAAMAGGLSGSQMARMGGMAQQGAGNRLQDIWNQQQQAQSQIGLQDAAQKFQMRSQLPQLYMQGNQATMGGLQQMGQIYAGQAAAGDYQSQKK